MAEQDTFKFKLSERAAGSDHVDICIGEFKGIFRRADEPFTVTAADATYLRNSPYFVEVVETQAEIDARLKQEEEKRQAEEADRRKADEERLRAEGEAKRERKASAE